ncbi:MAG: DpnD/PcfM family protein [Oscillospiraceae bacterium]|nr:DpnD/PcfM family protein [Oscillospiraceae bacterium]
MSHLTYQKTSFLSWYELSAMLTEEVSRILNRRVACRASFDEDTYWCVRFDDCRLPLSDVWHLLESVNTTEDLRRETLPSDDGVTSVRDLGMQLCSTLLKLHLNQDWAHEHITDDGLWLVNISDVPSRPALPKRFTVTIEETVTQDFDVEAVSLDDALELASSRYSSGEYVVDSSDVQNISFIAHDPETGASKSY